MRLQSKLFTILGVLLVLPAAAAAAGGKADAVPATRAPFEADAASSADPAPGDTLRLESIEFTGLSRTREHVLRRYWTLREGDTTSVEEVARAAAELRASPLFEDVRYSLRAGSERGAVQLRIAVRERRVRVNFGAGYRDLSGWYLIPLELGFDNLGGLGQELRAGARIGYRTAGVYLRYDEPRFLARDLSWGFRFYGDSIERVYFLDGVEYEHGTRRGGLDVHLERAPEAGWGYRLGYTAEQTEALSYTRARQDDPRRGLDDGERLEREDLPEGVREDTGIDRAVRIRGEILHDTRAATGLAASGLWSTVGVEGSTLGRGSLARLFTDARLYVPIASGLQAAARVQAAGVGEDAPFYDRYYLGGLYTVRGFPSQSLSPAAGDTRLATASLELRLRLHGRPDDPSIAGVIFVDAGDAWSRGGSPSLRQASAGAGYGLRIRLPWIGYAGLDAGVPLTHSPTDETFHLYGAIGWTF